MSGNGTDTFQGASGAVAWFRVWLGRIEIAQVERFTDTSVWVGGRRCVRESGSDAYFPTEDGAVAFLIRLRRADTDAHRRSYENAKSREGDLRAKYPSHPDWNKPRATPLGARSASVGSTP